MSEQPLLTGERNEILRVIRHVRNRWRLRVGLRSIAVLTAATLGMLVASSWGLEFYRFTPAAIVTFRILTYLVLIALGWWLFVRPVSRRVSDEQVALYLEEHEPSLQATLLSAVEETKKGERVAALDYSPELVHKVLQSAVEKVRDVEMGDSVERQKIQGSSWLVGAAAMIAVVLFLFGPSYLRHGVMALLTPMATPEAASPYSIDLVPGDVTLARGSDQSVTAKLLGFESDEVTLFTRAGESAPFERLPLVPLEEPGLFEVLLFNVQETTDYSVEAVGVQSETFTLTVVDLPYVERLEHEYFFPAYTGLDPRKVEDGGDIAVLAGTEVRLRAFSTMTTMGGQLVLDEEERAELVVQPDGSLGGAFVVEKDGFYRIDLQSAEGEMVTASPQYTIDVLTDQPPSVSFLRPGRDATASAIEELFIEARADDDYGLRSLELVYSVNGLEEKSVSLYRAGDDALKEISAGHTFFLEELELEPGDFLSYYARATDRNLAQTNKDIKSDLYFVQIRAFSRDFRAAQSQAGGGGGAGGGGAADPRALSEAQKEIVSGTFNVVRDRDSYMAEEYQENVVFLTLAQGRLREQVETLLRRMNSRVMPADPAFSSLAEILPKAADAMREAEGELQGQDADGALPPEQQALQHLQRAEEAYEEVMVQMGGGGGGGGGGSQAAQDLADLFELELDKLQNQYETMERGEQQQADNTVDELMERLRELAQRQEREAERQRMRSRGQQSAQGRGGAAQREIADEAEEAARRLEHLAREQNAPQMMDAARRLQDAADAMRRAAANNDNLGFAEAAAALDRLREVQDQLRQEQAGRLQRDIDEAFRRANRLADEEREIAADVNALEGQSGPQRSERLQSLTDRKNAMEAEVADLERQIDSTSAEFRREEQGASRRLQDAANGIRDSKLKEKIRYTRGVIRSSAYETARAFEEQITNDIEGLREHLQAAAEAVGDTQGDAMTQALDQTRDLMRGLESLDQRMWQQGQESAPGDEDAQQAESDQQGQQGQPGQQGEPGQNGQQGAGQQPGMADGRSGAGDTFGGAFTGGGYGNRRPGEMQFSPDEIRQWQREFRERLGEAQGIQRLLQQEQFAAGDLEDVIRQLQQLDDSRVYQDAEEIMRLQTFVLDELKRFEYRLRREVDVENEDLFLASSDEVPPGFRDLIEEYYRALSREN